MSLFDLIKQNDRIRFTADSFRQLAAFIIADISRRCTDQTSRTELLLIFAHIDTRHHVLVVKQIFRQRFGQLCLTDTCRSEENERTDRPFRVLQSGTTTTHSISNSTDSLLLPDHTRVQFRFQMEQFLLFALHHLADRNSCPTRYHIGDIFTVHFLLDHGGSTLHRLQFLLDFPDLFLLLFDLSVTDFSYFTVVAFTFGLIGFKLQVFDINLILLNLVDLLFFALPLSLLFRFFVLQVSNFLIELFQLSFIIFTLDRFTLNFQLLDTAGNLVERFRHRVDLQTQTGCCLIHQVDRLIGQEPVSDVSCRQLDGCNDGIIFDTDLMVVFIFFLQTTQDGNSIQFVRFVHHNNLETTFERLIFLKILLIFIQRRRTDRTQFTTSQSRFQDIGGIHRTFALTGTDQCMDLIDKKNDFPIRFSHFTHYSFQTFFKFALIFGPGNQSSHIQRENLFRFQIFRYVTPDDTMSKPLGNRRLTNTRFTNQNRVVFRTTTQDLKYTANFVVTTDHRIQLAATGTFVQIDRIFPQCIICVFGRLAGYFIPFPQFFNRLA